MICFSIYLTVKRLPVTGVALFSSISPRCSKFFVWQGQESLVGNAVRSSKMSVGKGRHSLTFVVDNINKVLYLFPSPYFPLNVSSVHLCVISRDVLESADTTGITDI